jgi:hypothetical protein
MAAVQGAISKRRKFVADGVFYAELNEFFQRELAEEGYSGVEVRVTPTVTDISTFILSVRSTGAQIRGGKYWHLCVVFGGEQLLRTQSKIQPSNTDLRSV